MCFVVDTESSWGDQVCCAEGRGSGCSQGSWDTGYSWWCTERSQWGTSCTGKSVSLVLFAVADNAYRDLSEALPALVRLSATYVATSCLSIACYGWHIICGHALCYLCVLSVTYVTIVLLVWISRPIKHRGNLGANMIEHVSEMELYIILSTLEKFERRNWTVLITKN